MITFWVHCLTSWFGQRRPRWTLSRSLTSIGKKCIASSNLNPQTSTSIKGWPTLMIFCVSKKTKLLLQKVFLPLLPSCIASSNLNPQTSASIKGWPTLMIFCVSKETKLLLQKVFLPLFTIVLFFVPFV